MQGRTGKRIGAGGRDGEVEAQAGALDGFDQHIVTGIGPYSMLILSQDPA